MSDLVLLVDVDSLLHQVLEDPAVSLPGCPAHPTVSRAVHCAEVCAVREENLQHVQPAQPGRDVDAALAVLVALVDVNVGHAEQLHQPALVVLLNGAEDGRQDKIVILQHKLPSLQNMTLTLDIVTRTDFFKTL